MLFKLLNVITLVAVEALLRLSRGELHTFHSLFNAQLHLAGKRSYVMCMSVCLWTGFNCTPPGTAEGVDEYGSVGVLGAGHELSRLNYVQNLRNPSLKRTREGE